jgi:iron complex outermembrane recepter protein
MKNPLLSLLFLIIFTKNLQAQNINGKVSANGKPADFVTVLLQATKDSAIIKGTVTGTEGEFDFKNVDAGRYFVTASMVGMGKGTIEAFDFDGKKLQLNEITLTESSTELAQATIVARKPVIEVRAEKTILNVEGTVNSTGLNALELLRKAPGVTVDNNENLIVKGKNQVKIMIDGRDTPLDGKDLAAFLKSTQAADISNIEIISNPSAKYDASGNAGIINIRLKKNKSFGTNGNVGIEAIYGQSFKGGTNISLNNRNKKVNLFGSYNNFLGDWHNSNDFVREQNSTVFNQKAKSVSTNKYHGGRVGADYFINEKHTVGVLFSSSYNPNKWVNESRADISNANLRQNIDSILVATNVQEGKNNNFNGNLNYRFADTSGHSLNIDLDRGAFRIGGTSYQPNYYRSALGNELLNERIFRNNTPTDIDIMTGKVDYEQRFYKGTLGVGAKISKVDTDNTFDFFNVKNGQNILDKDVSNRFIYAEQTNAGYVNYNRMLSKKLNLQAGLRMENTDYSGDLVTMNNSDSTIADNYTEWFPSGALTYTINQKMGINATYSRRIDRPSYQDLNPFEFKLDELTYQKGNPRLRPQFTNSFEIAPTYQGYPIISLGYSKTKDVFTEALFISTTNPNATFITKENLADQTNYTASLNFPVPLAKWWDGFVSLTAFRSHFKADFGNNITIDKSFVSGNLYSEQTAKLPKGWSVQLSGWWSPAGFWGTFKSSAQGSLDLGIKKKLWNDKGELRLRVGDLLGTSRWKGENIFTPGLKMAASGRWESQTVTLNLSYRFGSNEVKASRQRKTGLEDEKNRVKSGRN